MLRYVTWRDGRPRFNPSSREQALGFKSRDLKHPDGRWYTFEEANAYGEARYREIVAARPIKRKGRKYSPVRVGYVYFLFCGDEVKIGFSRDPVRRSRELATAMSKEADCLLVVRGSRGHEVALHRLLHEENIRQEWFRRTRKVEELASNLLLDCELVYAGIKPNSAAA